MTINFHQNVNNMDAANNSNNNNNHNNIIVKNYWMRLSRMSELFRQRSALSAEAEG